MENIEISIKMPVSKTHYNEEFHRQRKLDQSDLPKQKVLSVESRILLTQRRADLKKTQIELNSSCQFPTNTLREIESGRMQPTGSQMKTLNRVLGLQLKLE